MCIRDRYERDEKGSVNKLGVRQILIRLSDGAKNSIQTPMCEIWGRNLQGWLSSFVFPRSSR